MVIISLNSGRQKFKEFVFCRKAEDQSIDEYVAAFDNKVSRLQSSGQKIDGDITTFMMSRSL